MVKKRKKVIQIMIIDDHPIVRQGLKMILEREEDFSICAEASNASEAIRVIGDRNPDVVIVDISLDGTTNGIELVKGIKERYPGILSLVLSMYDESLYAERAIRAGASGYVMKKEADNNIISAIRLILKGDLYLSDDISKSIVKKLLHVSSDQELSPESVLTDRELEIFMMIGNGIGTREISRRLNLSLNTIETHRRHIKEKMQFKDLNELVKYAVQWVYVKK
jgi:DNA-binding NarL/FixJ family response regulator